MNTAKVTIVITTFNLAKYIAECLDSVIRQKTNFPYRILIADDCSQDATVAILKEYQAGYPHLIELMLSEKNLGSLANSNRALEAVTSDYFSFLDGDDYWLDDGRLQCQVDFLDTHPDYVMCGANSYYLVNGVRGKNVVESIVPDFDFDEYMGGKGCFVHTSSILLRNVIYRHGLPEILVNSVGTKSECSFRGEDFRFRIHLQKGRIRVFDALYSVYRIHDKGIWQGKSPFERYSVIALSNMDYARYFQGNYFGYYLNESYKACLVCLDLLDDALRDRDGSVTATPVQVAELWEIANDCLEHKDLLQNPSLGMKVKNKIRLEIYHSLRRKLKRSGLL